MCGRWTYSGEAAVVGVDSFLGDFLRRGTPLPEEFVSSDKEVARRKWLLRPLLSSGEGMLAEGGSVAGGRTSVKPRWSELIVFLGDFLRRENPNRRRMPAPTRRPFVGRPSYTEVLSSGERMFAGAGYMAGSCTPAKPRWSKVMIFLCDFLRQGSPSQEENK